MIEAIMQNTINIMQTNWSLSDPPIFVRKDEDLRTRRSRKNSVEISVKMTRSERICFSNNNHVSNLEYLIEFDHDIYGEKLDYSSEIERILRVHRFEFYDNSDIIHIKPREYDEIAKTELLKGKIEATLKIYLKT